MFEDKTNVVELLSNPLTAASATLSEIESRLGGNAVIADPNSPACHLLEAGASWNAAAIQGMMAKMEQLYPHRATSMEDLEHHMSDFDYLKMYATPSQGTIQLTFPKKYFIANALEYNDQYKKVTIPKDTVFTIGRYRYGIYYPIDILINKYTNTFTVVYDTSYTNPLHTLTRNVVNKYDFTYSGLDYILIEFPIYQFAKEIVTATIIPSTSYSQKFIYNNRFYALRAFSIKDGVYTELSQSQSKIVYDVYNPTILLNVLPDEQKLKLTIPQAYLDNDIIGTKLYLEIYTTMGELDIDTTNIDSSTIMINYNIDSKDTTKFSEILQNLPFDNIIKVSSAKITGGSNEIPFATLRDRVVNDRLYDKVPITEAEISDYFEDHNFYVKKALDNVTDRIYYAYRTLEDGAGNIIPSKSALLRILGSNISSYESFIKQSDDSYTILPTTVYQYNKDTDDVLPMKMSDVQALVDLGKEAYAAALNEGQYFKGLFHTRLDISGQYPKAISYNLMNPEIKQLIFKAENYNIALKMVAYEALIQHADEGAGGYDLRFSVYKSDDFANIAESEILVYVCVKTKDNYWIGGEATYLTSTNERTIYNLHIATNYLLTEEGRIAVTNLQNETIILSEHLIDLTSEFHVIYLVKRTSAGESYEDADATVVEGLPAAYLETYVALSRQYVTVELGYSLEDVIRNDIETSISPKTYAKYEVDVPMYYEKDEYARDETGAYKVTVNEDGTMELTLTHKAGDVVKDSNGNIVYAHKVGDIKYDTNGEPIVAVDREKLYYIDMMLVDAKVFASERNAQTSFIDNLYDTIESYFDVVRNLQDQLLERTYVYFKCVRSTGTARFNFGDGVVSKQNVEMDFKIVCYVPSYIKKDTTIQETIVAKTCDAIESAIRTKEISMLDVFEEVKSKLIDYIDHFDLLGINGDHTTQTFVIVDEDAQPSLKRQLVLNNDNVLSLEKALDITFISLDDNQDTTSVSV